MAFHCSMCSYTSTQFKQFSNHLVRYHRNDPHFIVHCSFSDCMYSTRSWNAFKLHVSRKHRHDRQSDDVNYVVSSSSCGSDDDADANHYSIQQWFTASYLLKLETQYKMPQQGINDVVSCTGTYMKQSLDNFKLQLKKRLSEGQPIDNAIEDIELSSLDTFATTYMRDKFYETIYVVM